MNKTATSRAISTALSIGLSIGAGTTLTLATAANAANKVSVDDTVTKSVTTGAKAVSIGNAAQFNGDLRDIKPRLGWQPGDAVKVANPRHIRDIQTILPAVNKVTDKADPLLQKQLKTKAKNRFKRDAVTGVNIDGIAFTGVNPPDTTGDIGLKYYIQSINGAQGSVFSIYDKIDGAKVAGPLNMADLASGDCTQSLGDPVVLFDEQAKRWLLTEFSSQETKKLCVLVSKTDDPVTGGWYSYEFQAPEFPDYPKYSQMGGVYYASANESKSAIYAFERSKMLNGQPAAMIRQEIPTLAGFGFNAITPVDVDGEKDLAIGAPGMFIRHRDDELHNAGANNAEQDFLEIWTLTADFASADNSKLEGPFNIKITEFDSNFNCSDAGFGCLVQKDTDQTLDPLREVVMYKGQYRQFDSHESLVGNFITKVGENTAAIRWFELRRVGDSDWSVHQEGTYSESDGNNRYMGASAMDGDGNIAMAYMLTGSGQYPSLAYNGRAVGDEAGTLTFGEQIIIEGTGAIESDRDGDYSQMGIDPVDNCTMWFTGEYGRAGGEWGTRVASFKVPSCGDPNPGFTLSATNLTQQVCASGDLQPITIGASGYNEFNKAVKLSYVDLPDGISGSFTTDSIKPGEQAIANLTVAQNTAAGSFVLKVKGFSDGAIERVIQSKLRVMDKKAETAGVLPANNAEKVALLPTLKWSTDGRASSYRVEIATDEAFSNIVTQATISGGDSYRPSTPLVEETLYYWRVSAANSCGELVSAVAKFTTGSEKDGATELQKGVTSEPFSGETDSSNFFYIDVPAGTTDLTFTINGEDGDADLYVAAGIRPQPGSDLVCRGENEGSQETCVVEGEVEGTYYAVVVGYDAYNNATISATFAGAGTTGPVISSQTVLSTIEDSALTISPDDLVVEDDNYPTGYTLTLLAGENYSVTGSTVTPVANFSGELTVQAIVNNGEVDSAAFNLKIQVTPVNDAPIIIDTSSLTVDEDGEVTLQLSDLSVNDVDNEYPGGFSLMIAAGANYTVVGQVITPAENFNGSLNVGVIVNDGAANSNAATLQLTVSPVNDAPVTQDDTATVVEDSSANIIDVLVNDSDIDAGDTLTIASVSYTGTGAAIISEGKLSYTPKTGFSGSEAIEYTVKDSAGAQKSASVAVTVTAKPVTPTPAPTNTRRSGGGGMSGGLMLLLLPLLAIRRLFLK